MKPQIFCIRFLQFVFVSLFVVSCIKPEENIPTPENQYLISAQKITDVSLAEIQQRAGLLAGLAKNEVSAFKLRKRRLLPIKRPETWKLI
jgi:hypothetical protein